MNTKIETQEQRKKAGGCERAAAASHLLSFSSVYGFVGGAVFPCDGQGQVDLEAMTEADRLTFRFAVSSVGQDFEPPVVLSVH